MRIDKALSNSTEYSRKEITKIIKQGNVMINNKIITDPSFYIDINKDSIFLYEEKIILNNKIYIALNKPKGYISSNSNKDGLSILNLLNNVCYKNLHIVGRLDKDTTGLILITNDGNFTHRIKSSKFNIEKEYEVELEKEFSQEQKKALEQPIKMDDKFLKEFWIKNVNGNKLNIILKEGKHHQIKRLFNMANNKVINLKRIRIGKLILKKIKIEEGQYIFINPIDIV